MLFSAKIAELEKQAKSLESKLTEAGIAVPERPEAKEGPGLFMGKIKALTTHIETLKAAGAGAAPVVKGPGASPVGKAPKGTMLRSEFQKQCTDSVRGLRDRVLSPGHRYRGPCDWKQLP